MWKVLWCLALFVEAAQVGLAENIPATGSNVTIAKSAPGSDPMAVGKAALAKEDYASARTFFERYSKDNPNDFEALFLLANADLGLRNFAAAELGFRAALALKPDQLIAHKSLVIVYAESGRWKEFDAERAVVAAAEAAKGPGVTTASFQSDVIDVFEVNGDRYIAREFYQLAGHFHTRYRFVHIGPDGKILAWIDCESDDVDQASFAKNHPKEAAEGKRSFSLDSYTAPSMQPNGQQTQTHATLKFYADGEPTYEAVRADVIKAVGGKSGAISSSGLNAK